MAKKVALLIGVSEYEAGLSPIPTAVNDVKAMQRVLQNSHLGGFEVKTLENPDLFTMQLVIEELFKNCDKDDLTLLFFTGHGIIDKSERLYLATRTTRKDTFLSTAVSASIVQNIMKISPSKQQVVILDCCYSGAFAIGWEPKPTSVGCALLASSTVARPAFSAEESGIYTKYIVQGIETGAADLDKNGVISVDELHDYAKAKVQADKPEMKPEMHPFREGFKIQIAKAPTAQVHAWRCEYTLTNHLDTVNCVAISPDGQTLVSSSGDRTIKIWNLNTGKQLRTLEGHENSVNCLAISPDGQTLATGSSDKTIIIWHLHTGKQVHKLGNWLAPAHLGSIDSLAIAPDGQTLISGSRDHTIKLWNLSTGKQIRKLSQDSWGAYSVAITPDGQAIASDCLDHTIKLYSWDTEELLQNFSGHADWIWAIAISPNGKILASGSQDCTVKLWNLETGQLLHTIKDHSSPVHSIIFSWDGQFFASGSYDNTIKLWSIENWQLLHTLIGHTNGVNAIAVSPNGRIIASTQRRK